MRPPHPVAAPKKSARPWERRHSRDLHQLHLHPPDRSDGRIHPSRGAAVQHRLGAEHRVRVGWGQLDARPWGPHRGLAVAAVETPAQRAAPVTRAATRTRPAPRCRKSVNGCIESGFSFDGYGRKSTLKKSVDIPKRQAYCWVAYPTFRGEGGACTVLLKPMAAGRSAPFENCEAIASVGHDTGTRLLWEGL